MIKNESFIDLEWKFVSFRVILFSVEALFFDDCILLPFMFEGICGLLVCDMPYEYFIKVVNGAKAF